MSGITAQQQTKDKAMTATYAKFNQLSVSLDARINDMQRAASMINRARRHFEDNEHAKARTKLNKAMGLLDKYHVNMTDLLARDLDAIEVIVNND